MPELWADRVWGRVRIGSGVGPDRVRIGSGSGLGVARKWPGSGPEVARKWPGACRGHFRIGSGLGRSGRDRWVGSLSAAPRGNGSVSGPEVAPPKAVLQEAAWKWPRSSFFYAPPRELLVEHPPTSQGNLMQRAAFRGARKEASSGLSQYHSQRSLCLEFLLFSLWVGFAARTIVDATFAVPACFFVAQTSTCPGLLGCGRSGPANVKNLPKITPLSPIVSLLICPSQRELGTVLPLIPVFFFSGPNTMAPCLGPDPRK